MVVHKGNPPRCPIWFICHCLVVDEANFFQCCGYYCIACRGRVNDERKYKDPNLKVHWDNHA